MIQILRMLNIASTFMVQEKQLFAKLMSYILILKIKKNMANLVDENSFTKAYSNLNKNLKMTETNLWQILLLLKVLKQNWQLPVL